MDAPKVKTIGELKRILENYPDDKLICTSRYNTDDEYDLVTEVGAMDFNNKYFYIGQFFGVPN